MGVELRPLAASFGVEVVGLDVRAGPSDADRERVVDAFFVQHLVLVRDQQQISVDEQLAFASWFGTLRTPSREIHPHLRDTDLRYTYLSNTREDGTGGANAELTPHQDYSFADPVGAICLYAIEVSTAGGETGFIDAAEAYTRLPAPLREQISDLSAVHFERFARGPVPSRTRHPVVLHHPVTGIAILFVNPLFTESIPDTDDDSLLAELQVSFEAPAIQYWHRWRPGDLLIWDNLVLQHARKGFAATDRRTLRRCQIDFSAVGSTAPPAISR
ncbi:MAG: TauD/TfdA family dioxygenase [Acidimicrobiales bacterium]